MRACIASSPFRSLALPKLSERVPTSLDAPCDASSLLLPCSVFKTASSRLRVGRSTPAVSVISSIEGIVGSLALTPSLLSLSRASRFSSTMSLLASNAFVRPQLPLLNLEMMAELALMPLRAPVAFFAVFVLGFVLQKYQLKLRRR